jgi:hypothetical protein
VELAPIGQEQRAVSGVADERVAEVVDRARLAGALDEQLRRESFSEDSLASEMATRMSRRTSMPSTAASCATGLAGPRRSILAPSGPASVSGTRFLGSGPVSSNDSSFSVSTPLSRRPLVNSSM